MGAVVLSQSELAKFGTRFRSDAGLKCWIVRTTDGKCCSWCTSIAGRYEYGKEPQSVYRRHDNCGCTVTYENGRQRQDVWSKRTWESDQPTPVRVEPTRLTGAQGREIEQRNLSQITRFSHAQGEAVQGRNLRYRGTSQEYTAFSEAMGLPQQRERVTMDGAGNILHRKHRKQLTNAVGKAIIRAERNHLTGEPNSITQKENSKGGIERNYYGPDRKEFKQISNNDHGKPKQHPFGKHGEHAHDYIYDEDGNLIGRPIRELTDEERKENADIL